jgi:alanyl-tRNA synthetase
MNVTDKLYYRERQRLRAQATVLSVQGNEVVCDQTLFYPEGGGQAGDKGWIGGVRVIDTQKRGGRTIVRPDLPVVNVETEVVHIVEDSAAIPFEPQQQVDLLVEDQHRLGCARHHTSTHLVMGQIWKGYGKNSFTTQGCSIGPGEARIDLFTDIRFSGEVLRRIEAGVNEWIGTGAAVYTEAVPDVPEMFIWRCELEDAGTQPCGGMHVVRLSEIGSVTLKRSNKGRGLERIYIHAVMGGRFQ